MSTKKLVCGGGAALVSREGCAHPQPRRDGALLLPTSSPSSAEGEQLPPVTRRHLLVSLVLGVFLANHCSRVSSERSHHKILTKAYQRP